MKQYKIPTARQIEAYRLVYLVGLTQEEAATSMDITQQSIGELLDRFFACRPDLFGDGKNTGRKKIISFEYEKTYKIRHKF